jgi:hypothetical protein
MELMKELINNYLANAELAGYLFLGGSILSFWFLRKPIRAFISSFFGYRADLDDLTFSEHNNRQVIYENEVAVLKSGMNIKNTILLILIFPIGLITPYASAIAIVAYRYNLAAEKLSKIKDYTVYKNFKSDDNFVNFLNTKISRIEFLSNQIVWTLHMLLALGIYFENIVIAGTALALISLAVFMMMLFTYNAYMLKVNYKYIEYYRTMRLFEHSSIGFGVPSMITLAILSFSTNFTSLSGFSMFVWLVLGLEMIASFSIVGALRREDTISKNHEDVENRNYTNLEKISSFPNLGSQSRGYSFSTAVQMKFFEISKNNSSNSLIHIDTYAFYPEAINRTILRKNPLLKETLSNSVKVSFDSLDFTKQLLILGGMGSGKTELVNYIIEQVHKNNFKHFKAVAYNDTKGDFSKNFYREQKDILLNLYDSRASVWCPFLEMKYNIEAGTAFLSNLFESISGDEKDFFSGRAKQLTSQWLQQSYFSTSNNIDAWDMFFSKIKEYELELEEKDDKTKSSILQTIQIALEILSIMYYQIVIEKRNTFTFTDFVKSEDIQIFFVNNKQYESKLTPYLNGLAATYINTVMAKEDTKSHLILNVFDEFLTMKIDNATRKTLLTATRSKGFANLLLAQYLINDEKLIQDLDSSRYALITFNINDDFTLEKVSKKISTAEYLATSVSMGGEGRGGTSSANGGAGAANPISGSMQMLSGGVGSRKHFSHSIAETKVLLEQQLQSMPKYHHLTFIPGEETKSLSDEDEKRCFRLMAFGYDKVLENIGNTDDFLNKKSGILYLGYTPQAKFTLNNTSFKMWDMREYYTFNSGKIKDTNNIFDTEREEFKHYINIKFAGSMENAKNYIREHGLEKYSIEKMFENVEENTEKVFTLMEKYSEKERFELMEQFFEIPEDNLDQKYDFCKEHDLIGCILGIFTFSDEFRNTILKGDIND